jgi:hypothetical protein
LNFSPYTSMRDFSRPALLIALVLLFLLLTKGGGFLLGISIAGGVRWLLIGLAVYLCFNCFGGGCFGRAGCGTRADEPESDD